MLEYKVSQNNIKSRLEPVHFLNVDISPDMSTLSGTVLQNERIDYLENIIVTNTKSSERVECPIQTVDKKRQGYIYITGDKYPILTTNYKDSPVIGAKVDEVKYIEFQHSYYYVAQTEEVPQEHVSIPYIVDENGEISSGMTDFFISNGEDGECIEVNYSVWVDDMKIVLRDEEYVIDPHYKDNSGHTFAIKHSMEGKALSEEELGVASAKLTLFENGKSYLVTDFSLSVENDILYDFEKITCGNNILIYSYKDVMRRCVNINPDGEPQWGIKNINDNIQDPKDAICYTIDSEYNEIPMSGDPFNRYSILNFADFNNYFFVNVEIDGKPEKIALRKEIQTSNSGTFILVHAPRGYMMGTGIKFSFIKSESSRHLPLLTPIISDEDKESGIEVTPEDDYVLYNGQAYYRKLNLCDQVLICDELFDITYENPSYVKEKKEDTAYVNIYGVIVEMTSIFEGDKHYLEKRTNEVLVEENGKQEYRFQKYEVVARDGVCIQNANYPIIEIDEEEIESRAEDETGTIESSYVEINRSIKYDFVVTDTFGTNIMIMSPLIKVIGFDAVEESAIKEKICYELSHDYSGFQMYYKSHLVANDVYEPGLGYIDSAHTSSSREFYDFEHNLQLYKEGNFISIDIPFTVKPANNIIQDDIQFTEFYEANKKKLINGIVDMEKDVYYPMYPQKKNNQYVFKNGFPYMLPVYEIDVNLHFRTRNLDNWKVIEDTTDKDKCNWFVTDYQPYKDKFSGREDELIEASDLLGYLNFTDGDVFGQKEKVGKSFLRMSIYDSPDMKTQTLLNTSTVWFDESYAYKKYISNNKRIDDLKFKMVDDKGKETTDNSLRVKYEPFQDNKYTLKDENRISSRFVIRNKYESQNSSEGFYQYIFKEYSQDLKPVPLYMKIEYNHAGIGQTIPFIVPMKWEDQNGYSIPTEKLTLKSSDIEELKNGYVLEDIYKQSYIPLYCAYDKVNHRYFYYFDDNYVTVDDGIVKLNLFEIKVADTRYNGKKLPRKFNLANQKVINDLIGNVIS